MSEEQDGRERGAQRQRCDRMQHRGAVRDMVEVPVLDHRAHLQEHPGDDDDLVSWIMQ